jgi:hypothetical protein
MPLKAHMKNGRVWTMSREYRTPAEAIEAATSKSLTGSLSIGAETWLFVEPGGAVRYADIDHFTTEETDD